MTSAGATATQWLYERLHGFGDACAVVQGARHCTYDELLAGVSQWRSTLAAEGVAAGDCVAVSGEFSPEVIMLLLALIAENSIVIPLAANVGAEKECLLQTAMAGHLIEFDSQGHWRHKRRDSASDHPLLERLRQEAEPGLILLSSGSTGQVKAAVHSVARLLSKFQRKRPGYRTLSFLLLDHVGGINTLFYVLTSGGTVVCPEDRTIETICEAIQRHRVQLLPTTPTFLNMLLISEAYRRYDLRSLELITYGTEPMLPATLESLHQVLPHVRFKQTYGLTEVGILPSSSEHSASLWLTMGGEGYETKVVDGILWIRAPQAMLGYLNAPSPFDAEGWLNTGDAVEQNGRYLRVLGRQSEVVNVGGQKVFPSEVENVLRTMPNVTDVAVRGMRNPLVGAVVVARIWLMEPEDPDVLERRVREFCRHRLAPFKIPAVVELSQGRLHTDRFKKIRTNDASSPPQ
jgi:acyl-coenzyme A synthetase/AMP-(fatty) acid ligase